MSFIPQTKSYPFSPAQAPAIVAQVLAGSDGAIVIDPEAPNGKVDYKGVKLAWTIANAPDRIAVTLLDRKFYDPSAEDIWTHLDKLFGGSAT